MILFSEQQLIRTLRTQVGYEAGTQEEFRGLWCEWFNEKMTLHKILQVQLMVEEIHLGIKLTRSIRAGLV